MAIAGTIFAGMDPLWAVILLTALPIFELRASIPFGYFTGMALWEVMGVAVLVNWLIAPLIYWLLKVCLNGMLRWGWFSRFWAGYSRRVLARTAKPMQSWGAFGLALFIGIPLPGSGVYTGAVAAYLLGMRLRTFVWVSLIGVCIAAILVAVVCVTGDEALSWMIKRP